MNKTDFEEIFKKGFNKKKIYYEDAEKGESELICFKCGKQAGLKGTGFFGITYKVVCVNEKRHEEDLLKYTAQYVEMEHDLLYCKLNGNCNSPIKTDY